MRILRKAGIVFLALLLASIVILQTSLGPSVHRIWSDTLVWWSALPSPSRELAAFVIAAIGSLAAIIAIFVGRSRRENPAIAPQRGSTFQFDYFTTDELGPLLSRVPYADFPCQPRFPPRRQSVFEAQLDAKFLLLTGRRGLGKTRECIELFIRLAQQKGEPITILWPKGDFDRPQIEDIPSDFAPRNLVLFIDEIEHRTEPRRLATSASQPQRSFRDRLSATIEWLREQYPGRDWRVVLTAADEPAYHDRLQLDTEFWAEFRKLQLPAVRKQVRPDFLRALAGHLGLQIEDDALALAAAKSDGTPLGMIVPLEQCARGSILTKRDIEQYEFRYPMDWQRQIYEKSIQPHPNRRAVFEALSVLRQLRIPTDSRLAIELASQIAWGPVFRWLGKRKIARTIRFDLNAWMFEYKGDIICPSAYLRDVATPSLYIRRFVKSTLSALRHADTRARLLESLPGAINRLAEELNDRQHAVELTEGALRFAPDSVPLLTKLAVLRGQMGRHQEGLEAAEAAVRHDGRDPHAIIALAFAQSLAGRNELALATSRRATKIAPHYDFVWLNLGVLLSKQGLQGEAITTLIRACELNPGSARAWYSLGIALERGGQENEALNACRMATRLDPLDALAWHTLGIAYDRAGNAPEALAAARRAEACDESNPAIKVGLARILFDSGEEQKAVEVLGAARTLAKGDPDKLTSVSNGFSFQRDHTQAALAARAALDIDPHHIGARRSLANNLSLLADGHDEAAKLAQELAKETGAFEDWFLLTGVLGQAERHEEAATAARKALAIDSHHIDARRRLAYNLSHLSSGREEAVELAQELAKETNAVEDWFLLTVVLSHAERREDAVSAARRTLAIDSHHIGARRNLAYNLSHLTDGREEAVEIIQKLAEETNAIEDWMQVIAVLAVSKRREEVAEVIRRLAEKTFAVEDWMQLAAMLDRNKLHKEAATATRSALAIDPHHIGARRSLAYHLSYLTDGSGEAVELIRQLAEETNAVEDWIELAAILDRAKRQEEAVTAARKALAVNPRHVGARRSLAYHLSQRADDREEATKVIRQLTEETNAVDDWVQRATILAKSERREEAVAAARRALTIDPHHTGARRSLAYDLSRLAGGREEAVQVIQRLAGETNAVEDWLCLAAILGVSGQYADAIAASQKAVAAAPNHVGAWHALMVNADQNGDFDLSLEASRRLSELEGTAHGISSELAEALEEAQAKPGSSKCWHDVAILYRNAGLVGKAISGAKATVEKDPENSSGVVALVEEFLSREPMDMIDLLELMLGSNPTNAHLLHLRGTAKRKAAERMATDRKAKQRQSAITDLRLACEKDPDPPHYWYALGKALEEFDSKPAACEAYKTAINKRGGRYPKAEMALKNLLTSEPAESAADGSADEQE